MARGDRLALSITQDDIGRLLKLFEDCGWDELRLELGGARLVFSRNADGPKVELSQMSSQTARPESPSAAGPSPSGGVPATAPAAAGEETPAAQHEAPRHEAPGHESGELFIRAPNLGIFWRRTEPGAPPHVEIGQVVDEETTVCLIEVMKLFTPVKAKVKGRVVEVLAEDGEMVERGRALFKLEPVR